MILSKNLIFIVLSFYNGNTYSVFSEIQLKPCVDISVLKFIFLLSCKCWHSQIDSIEFGVML